MVFSKGCSLSYENLQLHKISNLPSQFFRWNCFAYFFLLIGSFVTICFICMFPLQADQTICYMTFICRKSISFPCPCWNVFYLCIIKSWLLNFFIWINMHWSLYFTCSFCRFGRLYTRRMVQLRRSQELCNLKGIRLFFWFLYASQDCILEGWFSLFCLCVCLHVCTCIIQL